MTKYYVDAQGNYLGGFDGSIPDNSIEVVSPPDDARELFLNGVWVKPIALIVSYFESAIQTYLDVSAQAKGYDNITTASSYASAPNPFQAEGISFVTWRGNVWTYCYSELAKVQAGTRPMPTIEQIITELPVRV